MRARGTSKEIIFEKALELFARYGYAEVSMRQIAKAAGIAVASIYNHYPSKQELLEEVYHFYDSNMVRLCPDLDELLDMVPHVPPQEVLSKTTFIYPDDIKIRMGQASAVVMSLVQHDKRADDLMNKHLIELPSQYDIPLLTRMMELGRIEPIDPQHFALLHANYHLSAAVRFYTNHAIPNREWLDGLSLLFQLVREKPAPAETA